MTHAECVEATKGAMEQIEENREIKRLAVHNVPLGAFHDARATLDSIEVQVRVNSFYPTYSTHNNSLTSLRRCTPVPA